MTAIIRAEVFAGEVKMACFFYRYKIGGLFYLSDFSNFLSSQILQGREDHINGKTVKIALEDLWK